MNLISQGAPKLLSESLNCKTILHRDVTSDIEEFHIEVDKQITINILIHETSLITGEAKAKIIHKMKLAAP